MNQTARQTSYGQRQQHRNNNQLVGGQAAQAVSTGDNPLLSQQSTATQRTYASSKPLQRRVAQRTKTSEAHQPLQQVES